MDFSHHAKLAQDQTDGKRSFQEPQNFTRLEVTLTMFGVKVHFCLTRKKLDESKLFGRQKITAVKTWRLEEKEEKYVKNPTF